MSNSYVCVHKQTRRVWGHASPENFLEIRCSEILM